MTDDGTKLFGIRVHNLTRSCILVKQFPNGVWTLPVLQIPIEADPMDYMDAILEQVDKSDDFELISAVSMLDYAKEDMYGVVHSSVVYDVKYKGRVLTGITNKGPYKYARSQWMPRQVLQNQTHRNQPTNALIIGMEKEECLR